MGIKGTELGSKDLATLMPELGMATGTGGHPFILWKKNGMTGIKIYADRSEGAGYVFLTHDTEPDYTDTGALPPAGKSAIWRYKAIYMDGDNEAGQMSLEISVTGTM